MMMVVASGAAAVLPMVTIVRGCLVGGLSLGAARTILHCRLPGRSLH